MTKNVGTVLGVIPARYNSSRFEGKPLAKIAGVPMILRTYNQVKQSSLLNDAIVATDDPRILEFCHTENIPCCMTSSGCLTGTDRVYEVSEQLDYDLYINIQGDEPVIDPKSIDQILTLFSVHGDNYAAYNLYKYITDETEINSDTIIKVITNELDEVMYMSRLPVPFSKAGMVPNFKQQIPIYGYTKNALKTFAARAKTINEQFEDVELLRFIDMGLQIKMEETNVSSIAVDTPSDILKVERFLTAQKLN
ncbi:3-deoxy-manno-octulosonate cytidylyltransferase [Gilvimarinus japonicus]|uniref:3-deoxy-manno-octulosonate cytidylyltransferase n=1 Tax=Gilvimarinus japonicus TaxID=1796469 RepID=A0ABV7HW57_9GAMM